MSETLCINDSHKKGLIDDHSAVDHHLATDYKTMSECKEDDMLSDGEVEDEPIDKTQETHSTSGAEKSNLQELEIPLHESSSLVNPVDRSKKSKHHDKKEKSSHQKKKHIKHHHRHLSGTKHEARSPGSSTSSHHRQRTPLPKDSHSDRDSVGRVTSPSKHSRKRQRDRRHPSEERPLANSKTVRMDTLNDIPSGDSSEMKMDDAERSHPSRDRNTYNIGYDSPADVYDEHDDSRTQEDTYYDSDDPHRQDDFQDRPEGFGGRRGRRHRRNMELFSRRARFANPSAFSNRPPCIYFKEGRCGKGDQCNFSHDIAQRPKMELCKFYATSTCLKGSTCLYLHKEFPCKFHHYHGKCVQGANCLFSHAELTPIMRGLLQRFVQDKPFRLLHEEENLEALNFGKREGNNAIEKPASLLGAPPTSFVDRDEEHLDTPPFMLSISRSHDVDGGPPFYPREEHHVISPSEKLHDELSELREAVSNIREPDEREPPPAYNDVVAANVPDRFAREGLRMKDTEYPDEDSEELYYYQQQRGRSQMPFPPHGQQQFPHRPPLVPFRTAFSRHSTMGPNMGHQMNYLTGNINPLFRGAYRVGRMATNPQNYSSHAGNGANLDKTESSPHESPSHEAASHGTPPSSPGKESPHPEGGGQLPPPAAPPSLLRCPPPLMPPGYFRGPMPPALMRHPHPGRGSAGFPIPPHFRASGPGGGRIPLGMSLLPPYRGGPPFYPGNGPLQPPPRGPPGVMFSAPPSYPPPPHPPPHHTMDDDFGYMEGGSYDRSQDAVLDKPQDATTSSAYDMDMRMFLGANIDELMESTVSNVTPFSGNLPNPVTSPPFSHPRRASADCESPPVAPAKLTPDVNVEMQVNVENQARSSVPTVEPSPRSDIISEPPTFAPPGVLRLRDAPWNLVPLDVPLKVPYPLMQLPTNLPHSHNDPRLRGSISSALPSTAASSTTLRSPPSQLQRSLSQQQQAGATSASFSPLPTAPTKLIDPRLNAVVGSGDSVASSPMPTSLQQFSDLLKEDLAKTCTDNSGSSSPLLEGCTFGSSLSSVPLPLTSSVISNKPRLRLTLNENCALFRQNSAAASSTPVDNVTSQPSVPADNPTYPQDSAGDPNPDSTPSTPTVSTSVTADRSYLLDPRFKRRKTQTPENSQPTTSNNTDDSVSALPTDSASAPPSEANCLNT